MQLLLSLLWPIYSAILQDQAQVCSDLQLESIINGLSKAIHYIDKHKFEINLDGAFGVRLCTDQLDALLNSPVVEPVPEKTLKQLIYLRSFTAKILEEALPAVRKSDPKYFQSMGWLLEPRFWNSFYPSRKVNIALQKEPRRCSDTTWNETLSDICIGEIFRTAKENRYNEKKQCNVSKECWDLETARGYKGYLLTHQAIYFQVAENRGCLSQMDERNFGDFLRDSFCADILQEANNIEKANYPILEQDLFLEQIGICGLWGYADFFKEKWLRQLLNWQDSSGCFKHQRRYQCRDFSTKLRVKREDRKLKDGCSSHMTAVAMLAFMTNLRFCIETLKIERILFNSFNRR